MKGYYVRIHHSIEDSFLKAKDDRILQDKSDRILEGNTAKSLK
jgi:hypothetical protein